MSHQPRRASDGTALAYQALLYASGEMDGPELAAFEARLGEEQAAREALLQAVQLSLGQAGPASLRPDPAYRERVRARVQPAGGIRGWLARLRWYTGHPLAWGGLGALAAVLIMLGVAQGLLWRAPDPAAEPAPRKQERAASAERPVPPAPVPKPDVSLSSQEPAASASTAEARAWAQLQAAMPWRKRFLPAVKH